MRERRPNPSATSTLTAPGNGNHVPVTFRHLCPETAHVTYLKHVGWSDLAA